MAKKTESRKAKDAVTDEAEPTVPLNVYWSVTTDQEKRYDRALRKIRKGYLSMANRIEELDGTSDAQTRRYAILAQFAGLVYGMIEGLLIESEDPKEQQKPSPVTAAEVQPTITANTAAPVTIRGRVTKERKEVAV